MNPAEIKQIKKRLSTPKQIAILTHWSPDGDAMGSSLGLYNFLIQKDHKVTVVTPNDYPQFLNWLPGNNKVIDHNLNPAKAEAAVKKADIIFTLDFNTLKRIEKLGEVVREAPGIKVLIDHHQQPEDYAKYKLHDVNTSSTCELIYDFIILLKEKTLLNAKVASCLYTGIMTDTGSFRFPSTKAKTHRVIADLIDAGAINSEIHNHIYDGNTIDKLKLLGYCLFEKLNVLPEYNTAYISLTQEELKKFNYKKGDTESVVNFALSLSGIRFAVFIVERDDKIKLSLRSKGDFNVNLFARNHFSGGGHNNAAGGASELSVKGTIDKLLKLLPDYKKELTKK